MKTDLIDKRPVLLAAYGGGHVNALLPVYRKLRDLELNVQMLGLTMAQQKLSQHGLPFLTVQDFVEPLDQASLRLGERLVEDMTLNPSVSFEETVAYMGISYQELINDHGLMEAERLYATQGRQCFLQRRLARRILRTVSPSKLVTTNSPRLEQALLLEARSLGVPSLCLSDFWIVDRMRDPDYCDTMLVPFEAVKRRLIDSGWRPEDIVVSGNPALDYLASDDLAISGRLLREARGWGGKKVILFVKSVMPVLAPSEARVEAYLAKRYRGQEDTIVVVRPHPNDPRDYSAEVAGNFVISSANEPLLDVLAASDTIVTINSTVGLEANLLGKQVVQLNMVDFAEHVPFGELGIGFEATDIPTLDRALNGPDRLGLLPPFMSVGKAGDRVVDQILGGKTDRDLQETSKSTR